MGSLLPDGAGRRTAGAVVWAVYPWAMWLLPVLLFGLAIWHDPNGFHWVAQVLPIIIGALVLLGWWPYAILHRRGYDAFPRSVLVMIVLWWCCSAVVMTCFPNSIGDTQLLTELTFGLVAEGSTYDVLQAAFFAGLVPLAAAIVLSLAARPTWWAAPHPVHNSSESVSDGAFRSEPGAIRDTSEEL
ncbi:hypothetical protein [Microbacterium sp. NPDC087665]|uniref:hypothetical protein n=1 Tax=Microbacterium sp. NPDC087665 TaxID=3364194 RepID=UPI00382A2F18